MLATSMAGGGGGHVGQWSEVGGGGKFDVGSGSGVNELDSMSSGPVAAAGRLPEERPCPAENRVSVPASRC